MAKKKQKEKRRKLVFEVLIFVGLMLVATLIGVLMWWLSSENESELIKRGLVDRGLPVMEINLNEVSLEDINNGSKETKYLGNELTLYDKGKIKEINDVEIKGRGNLTWMQDKKSYQIKFKEKINLLGMGKARKWVLLSDYLDNSFLRNDVAMVLAEMLEVKYNIRGEFVELYFDGNYQGVYYVLHKVEIAKKSVDLRNVGGVLFEMDMLHRDGEECHASYLEGCLMLKDIVLDDVDSEESTIEIFINKMNEFEKALKEKKYTTIIEKIDIESFVKYFLINEFTANPDAYASSFYLYMDGVNDKIHAGPVWDFDLAFNNQRWKEIGGSDFSPKDNLVRRDEAFGQGKYSKQGEDLNISKIFYYLMEMPEFREQVGKIFHEKMSGKGQELLSEIVNQAIRIRAATLADSAKWNKDSFDEDLKNILYWIKIRYEFFEQMYGI